MNIFFKSRMNSQRGSAAWLVTMMMASVVVLTIGQRYLNVKAKFSTARTLAGKENTDNYLTYAINQTSNLISVGAISVLERTDAKPYVQSNQPDNTTFTIGYNSTESVFEVIFNIANPKYLEFSGESGDVETNGEPQTLAVKVQVLQLTLEQKETTGSEDEVINNSIKVKATMSYPLVRSQFSVIRPQIVRFDKTTQGYDHTCALGSNGAAYCWGRNDAGQLGIGRTDTDIIYPKGYPFPQKVLGNHFFLEIYAGKKFTCGKVKVSDPVLMNANRTKLGKIYCWGLNSNGQLGDGTYISKTVPTPIIKGNLPNDAALDTIDSFGVGYTHACATEYLTRLAVCWGERRYTGTGSLVGNLSAPMYIVTSPNLGSNGYFQFLRVGPEHSCGITSTSSTKNNFVYNRIYCWGNNDKGQLGNGSNIADVGTHFPTQAVQVQNPPSSVSNAIIAWAGHVLPPLLLYKNAACANFDMNISRRRIYCWGDFAPGGRSATSTPEWIGDPAGLNYQKDIYELDAGAHATAGGKIWAIEGGDGAHMGGGNFNRGLIANDPPSTGHARNLVTFDNYIGDNTRTVVTLEDGAVRKLFALGYGVARGSADPVTVGHICVTLVNLRPYCWGDSSYGQLGQGEQYLKNAQVTHNDFPDYFEIPMERRVAQPFPMDYE